MNYFLLAILILLILYILFLAKSNKIKEDEYNQDEKNIKMNEHQIKMINNNKSEVCFPIQNYFKQVCARKDFIDFI
jgi:hypothetical protein